jgi:hypothetical protein
MKRAEDAEEVSALVEHWGRQRVYMVSLTSRHRHHALRPTYEGQSDAWNRVAHGRPWRRFAEKWGVEYIVRAADFMYGENGWHPHLHVLLFIDHPLTDAERVEFDGFLADRWERMVVSALGAKARPTAEHGCVVTECRDAKYLTKLGLETIADTRKIGLELTLDVTKRGKLGSRSPWQIAWDAAEYQRSEDGRLWVDFTTSMKGKQLLTWSDGAHELARELVQRSKKAVEVEVEVPEDAEHQIESGAAPGEESFAIPGETWDVVRDLHGGTRAGGDAWSARGRIVEEARDAVPGDAQGAVDRVIAALHAEHPGQIAFIRAERQRREEARAAEQRREQEAHARRQAEQAAQRAAERVAEAEDWRLRHRSILDALPWREREAWLTKVKAAAFERAKPRKQVGSWARVLASVAAHRSILDALPWHEREAWLHADAAAA